MEALRIQGLVQRYGPRTVLAEIDLAVGRGEVVGLAGANGAGKSTLLRCCAGILRPSVGAVRVSGRPAEHALRRGWIGLAAGGGHRFDRRLTLRRNLEHHARLSGVARAERSLRVQELAEAFGIAEHLAATADRCSSGTRARADLVRALLGRPRLLLLDEPLASVDSESRPRLARALRERAGDAACVWVSHEAGDLARDADRSLRLDKGRLHPGPRS